MVSKNFNNTDLDKSLNCRINEGYKSSYKQIRLIKYHKRIALVKQLNQFYACISTVDHTYNDYIVTLADLYDDNEVSSILYDLNDNCFIYYGAYDLYRKLEEVR